MALSGTDIAYFSTTPALYIKTVWSATQAGNYSDITCNYYVGKTTAGSLYVGLDASLTIDGTLKFNYTDLPFTFTGGNEFLVGTGTKRVYHNSEGYRSFNIYAYGELGSGGNTASINHTYSLNRIIPSGSQYATISNFNATVISCKKIGYSYLVDSPCDACEYSINDGAWVDATPSLATGYFEIDTYSPNTYYNLKIHVRKTSSQLWTATSNIGRTTHPLNTISSGTNFNIGSPLTANIQRASTLLVGTLKVLYGGFAKTLATDITNSYTWDTSIDANDLYAQMPNENTGQGTLYLETWENNVLQGTTQKDFYATVVDANPAFTTFTYQDINSAIRAVAKTVTMTIANPCVVTLNNHNFANGTPVKFTTTGALPTGLTANTTYYARSTGANTINLYDTSAHAIAGGTTGRKTTSGTQSGVHTMAYALTTSDQSIVKGYSTVRAIITSANKAVAIKGANMTRAGVAGYRFSVGSMPPSALTAYSASSTVNIDIANANDDTLIVSATDSRGNSTSKEITVASENFIQYFTPIISTASIQRTNNTETTTTLTLNGSFFNASFGNVTNDIAVTYRYKQTDSETWGSWSSPLTIAKNGNDFSFSDEIVGDLGATGFDIQNAYQLQVKVTDELSSYTYGETNQFILGSAIPFGSKYKTSQGIGTFVDETIADLGKSIQLGTDNIYVKHNNVMTHLFGLMWPIGRGFIDFTDTDYSNYLGFTWEKTCIGRTPVGKDTTQTEFDTIGETGGHKALQAHSHGLTVGAKTNSWVAPNFVLNYQYQSQAVTYSETSSAGTGDSGNLQPYQVVNFWKRTA